MSGSALSSKDHTSGGQVCSVHLPTSGQIRGEERIEQTVIVAVFIRDWRRQPLCVFVETCGTKQGSPIADDITNVLKIEFGKLGITAVSLVLGEPKAPGDDGVLAW